MAGMSAGQSGLTNEPNVVPMIDVLLVLLIIFMMMIPLSRVAIDLQLPDPKPPEEETPPPDTKQIVMEILPGGVYAVNKEAIPKERLAARLKEIYDPRPEKVIFIKGDPTVKYQDVIWSMDVARGAGVKVLGVPPKSDAAPAPSN